MNLLVVLFDENYFKGFSTNENLVVPVIPVFISNTIMYGQIRDKCSISGFLLKVRIQIYPYYIMLTSCMLGRPRVITCNPRLTRSAHDYTPRDGITIINNIIIVRSWSDNQVRPTTSYVVDEFSGRMRYVEYIFFFFLRI